MLHRLLKRLPISFYPYKSYMHKYHVIFIHIPKNAGTSVLSLLGSNGSRWHAKWIHYKRASGYFFNKYHKFAIVRNPTERLYSSYKYCLQGGNGSVEDYNLKALIEAKSIDFDSFIINVLNSDLLMREVIFQPQYLYVFDKSDSLMVDTILRYESLLSDWSILADALQLPKELPWLNASSENKVKTIPKISQAAMDKINTLYQADFTLLGYKAKSDIS
jgi:hypothetical protein